MARLPFDPKKTRAAQQSDAPPASGAPSDAAAGSSASGADGGESAPAADASQPAGSGNDTQIAKQPDRPLRVSEVTGRIKAALGDHFPRKIRVAGEVLNFSDRAHWFFSLTDDQATLRCVCFAPNARKVGFQLADGMEVVATGRVDFYDQQGHVQLYVDKLEPVGQGALELKLRQLIDELRERGYFAPERKRSLPAVPRRLAVVTSRSAAALQDVINTARRRWPGCELLLYDVRVQGADAAPMIARAIDKLSQHHDTLAIDGVILTRGGGSIEDLWAFNERSVADALFRCSIPTVAAIGHETDTTVAELVADRRCATPTQAAMTLVPDRASLQHQLDQLADRLTSVTHRLLERGRHRLMLAARHALFRQPAQLAMQARRRLQDDARRLDRALPQRLTPAKKQLRDLETRWRQVLPRRLQPARDRLERVEARLRRSMPRRLVSDKQRLDAAARHLEAVGPANVLKRGYSYTLDESGALITRATHAPPGRVITTVLQDGRVRSRVEANDGEANDRAPKPTRSRDTESRKPSEGSSASSKRSTRRDQPSQGGLFDP